MSDIALFLTLGLLLGILLAILARRHPELPALETKEISDPGSALELLRFELLPPATLDILFSRGDWDFVGKTGSRRIQRLFLRERTVLVLFWLEETRRLISGLMKMHRRAARTLKDIRPRTEAGLALQYAAFLLAYGLLRLAVGLWGPFRVRGAVVRSATSARELCAVFEKFFAAHQQNTLHLNISSQFRS